jgi:hypothetical protein
MLRLVLGFVVAALWLPAYAYVLSRSLVESGAVLVAMFTVPLTLFVAAPLYWALRERVGFLACICAGLCVGAIGCLLFWLSTNTLAALNWSPLLLAAGLVSSFLFWVVALWGNKYLPQKNGRKVSETVA